MQAASRIGHEWPPWVGGEEKRWRQLSENSIIHFIFAAEGKGAHWCLCLQTSSVQKWPAQIRRRITLAWHWSKRKNSIKATPQETSLEKEGDIDWYIGIEWRWTYTHPLLRIQRIKLIPQLHARCLSRAARDGNRWRGQLCKFDIFRSKGNKIWP